VIRVGSTVTPGGTGAFARAVKTVVDSQRTTSVLGPGHPAMGARVGCFSNAKRTRPALARHGVIFEKLSDAVERSTVVALLVAPFADCSSTGRLAPPYRYRL
jgi:hypothetical protein